MLATRRSLLLAAALLAPGRAQAFFWESEPAPTALEPPDPATNRAAWFVGTIPDAPFDIPMVDLTLVPAEFRRQRVAYDGPERAGTLVVDTHQRFLFLVGAGRTALRYGIGVGRAGFTWSGIATVRRKATWPGWHPTAAMLKRRPDLPRYVAPGLDNPLGCRALYLYQGDRDTLYRIHGTNEPWTVGGTDSSGCIRLLNEDIHDLYGRVALGTTVVVKTSQPEVMVQREWDGPPRSDDRVRVVR
ncbi:L,D-transpeptidase [Methylobacterium sp. Leaf118]|uniref:L,D-transpeptidase n=1 Tax=Methylobacterium sp. Leaf118 TaxID=2876562 RepID=UPI001E61211A|nr:L,D-transpeptidase [Methylobacterium sp. Leaf118]